MRKHIAVFLALAVLLTTVCAGYAFAATTDISGNIQPLVGAVVVEPSQIDLSSVAGTEVTKNYSLRNTGNSNVDIMLANSSDFTFTGLTAVKPGNFNPNDVAQKNNCRLVLNRDNIEFCHFETAFDGACNPDGNVWTGGGICTLTPGESKPLDLIFQSSAKLEEYTSISGKITYTILQA